MTHISNGDIQWLAALDTGSTITVPNDCVLLESRGAISITVNGSEVEDGDSIKFGDNVVIYPYPNVKYTFIKIRYLTTSSDHGQNNGAE